MILWRISDHATLDGKGGLLAGGRWHSKGKPIVYLAESSALAMIEVLVHLEVDTVPPPFQLMKVEVQDELAFENCPDHCEGEQAERMWGDAWLAAARTALARVPSRIAPGASNWLLNPLHADAKRLRIVASSRYPWDKRLFSR